MRNFILQRAQEKIYGVCHYLSGEKKLDEVICKTDVPDFCIIFSGACVPNATELLGTDQFKQLILELRERFDYVIVDTPPLGQVIDCAVMAPALDGVIILIDAMRNSYRMERRILAQLRKAGGKILGVILNRVDFEDKMGYYGKAYDVQYDYT